MSITTNTRPEIAGTYAPPASRETLLAQAFSCILNGRPFPEALRPPSYTSARPESVEAGLARVQSAFHVAGVPSTYLVGRDGRLRWLQVGGIHGATAAARAAIDSALAAERVSSTR